MRDDPRECRDRAARRLELAAEAANEGIKQTFLNIAKHWQILAEELERAKAILDDEKGAIKLRVKKRRGKRPSSGKLRRKSKSAGGAVRRKRANDEAMWSLW
jgi:hypothetical protein